MQCMGISVIKKGLQIDDKIIVEKIIIKKGPYSLKKVITQIHHPIFR